MAVADNDSAKWGTLIEGIPCDSFDNIIEMYDNVLVIVCSKYQDDIREYLQSYDVRVVEESSFMAFIRVAWMQEVYLPDSDDSIVYVRGWFRIYDALSQNNQLSQMKEELFSYVTDEKSRRYVDTRIQFLLTGNLDLIKNNGCNSTPEYFDSEYLTFNDEEVFVDCGAYRGDTIQEFVSAVKGKYKHIYAFEADSKSYNMLCDTTHKMQLSNIDIYEKAVGKENGELCFLSDGTTGAQMGDYGNVYVPVVKLDDVIKEKVTFLKMDIEGSELDALQGASEIIKKYKPSLAICIYHKALDIFEIPSYIHSLVPEYEFKIGWHAASLFKMVLYATIPSEE